MVCFFKLLIKDFFSLHIFIFTEFLHSLAAVCKLLPARGLKRPRVTTEELDSDLAAQHLKMNMLDPVIKWMHVSVKFYLFSDSFLFEKI